MKNISVSIIIPAYNEEKYIKGCLESLKNQTHRDFEVIVVDNNSVDDTKKISSKYTKKVVSCKKQGISAARNFGAKHASGDILCFIDADAVVSKHWIKSLKETFEKNKNIAAVNGFIIFPSNDPIKYLLYNFYNVIVFSCLFVGNKVGKYFVSGNNMAIRKELFFRVGGFPEQVVEDIWLARKLRKYKSLNIMFNPKMKIYYSPRRFEKKGLIKTLTIWYKSSMANVSEAEYKEEY
jgi:glycosyltransferase involved in cell wall biosynthesis